MVKYLNKIWDPSYGVLYQGAGDLELAWQTNAVDHFYYAYTNSIGQVKVINATSTAAKETIFTDTPRP
jgi:hypothetical protein